MTPVGSQRHRKKKRRLKASKRNPVTTKYRNSLTFQFPLFYFCVKLKPLCYASFFDARFWILLSNSVNFIHGYRVLVIRSAGSIPSTSSKYLTAWDAKFSRWAALGSWPSDATAFTFYVNTNISEEPAAKIPGSHIPGHLALKVSSYWSSVLLSWNSVILSRVSSTTFTLCDLLR